MQSPLAALTQSELLALAVDATRRGDSGHSMAYLKEASSRDDASAQALFLLGSEYAQVGLVSEAKASFGRAVQAAPGLLIARFQLGLLHLTLGEPNEAQAVWAPLAQADSADPQTACLQAFHRGLLHLIRDEFGAAIQAIEVGMQLNGENAALNVDMQKIAEAIRSVPGADLSVPAAAQEPPAVDEAPAAEAGGHLYINAYTRGKPH